jgi:hypothetical protein
MTDRDKIGEILTTVGVAERDFDAARRNFERLGPAEIDRRLEKLRAGSTRIAQWRAERGPAEGSRTLTKPDERKATLETIHRQLAELTRVMERLSSTQDTGLLRDIGEKHRLLTHNLAPVDEAAHTRFEGFVKTKIEAMSALDGLAVNLATRDIATITRHPLIPGHRGSLTTSDALDAFGRVANAVSRTRPELFVSVNEGFAIARLIRDLLRLETPITIVRGSVDRGLEWPRRDRAIVAPSVVWVVGHIARTGATLVKTMQETRRRYGAKEVYGAVLVASTDAASNFGKFYFHQMMEASTIGLGFDSSKDEDGRKRFRFWRR